MCKNMTNVRRKSLIKNGAIPTITLDSETKAAYIRFSKNKVAKTIDEVNGGTIVNIDIDSKGNVVGIELVGN